MNFLPNDIVRSCPKLESGLRLGIEGIHACQLGPFSSPLFWTADEAAEINITKEMIVEKRKRLFQTLNDDQEDITCRRCHMVKNKHFKDVDFTRLGRIDLAATTICNLRCNFCGFSAQNAYCASKYDALAILREFSPADVEWDSMVDFNGGEPTLLPDFDEYIDYFTFMRIRVLLYTNGVIFRQSVYDGLVKGTISWVCTSVDAGTPSSYLHIKKRDYFLQTLKNITRYAYAGSQGGGMFAAKYIFCPDNCGDDDVAGFVYAMLAIRPQKVWLTFDFTPFGNLSDDYEGPDYSKLIAAYVKMYNLLKENGIIATHYTEGHLALICQQGKNLLNKVLSEIDKSALPASTPIVTSLSEDNHSSLTPIRFKTMPLRVTMPGGDSEPWSLEGKRIALVPACSLSVGLLSDPDIRKGQIIGFLDRNPVLQGKNIEGIIINGYQAIPAMDPQVIIVASPRQHQQDILNQLAKFMDKPINIALLDQD
jgi:uncharacterized Fe-S cluster-containing radical SAM superfamily protein